MWRSLVYRNNICRIHNKINKFELHRCGPHSARDFQANSYQSVKFNFHSGEISGPTFCAHKHFPVTGMCVIKTHPAVVVCNKSRRNLSLCLLFPSNTKKDNYFSIKFRADGRVRALLSPQKKSAKINTISIAITDESCSCICKTPEPKIHCATNSRVIPGMYPKKNTPRQVLFVQCNDEARTTFLSK